MTEFGKSPGALAAEIVMSRQNWNGAFMIVEGPCDSRFFNARKSSTCEVVLGWGRRNVVEAIKILDGRNEAGVCGVIDDDFDSLPNSSPTISPNLIRTDPRDLEGILLRSSALEKALSEFCRIDALTTFVSAEPPSIANALLRRALLFGKIHYINSRGPQVCLKSLKPMRFIDPAKWEYSENEIKIVAVGLGVSSDVASLNHEIALVPDFPPWLLCRGHDLIDILYGGFLRCFGSGRATPDALESVLRSGIERREFDLTELMARIRDWEAAQAPFRLLA